MKLTRRQLRRIILNEVEGTVNLGGIRRTLLKKDSAKAGKKQVSDMEKNYGKQKVQKHGAEKIAKLESEFDTKFTKSDIGKTLTSVDKDAVVAKIFKMLKLYYVSYKLGDKNSIRRRDVDAHLK